MPTGTGTTTIGLTTKARALVTDIVGANRGQAPATAILRAQCMEIAATTKKSSARTTTT